MPFQICPARCRIQPYSTKNASARCFGLYGDSQPRQDFSCSLHILFPDAVTGALFHQIGPSRKPRRQRLPASPRRQARLHEQGNSSICKHARIFPGPLRTGHRARKHELQATPDFCRFIVEDDGNGGSQPIGGETVTVSVCHSHIGQFDKYVAHRSHASADGEWAIHRVKDRLHSFAGAGTRLWMASRSCNICRGFSKMKAAPIVFASLRY